MLRRLLCAAALVSGPLAAAQDKPKEQPKKLPRIAVSDPKDLKDDKDFAVQGEYVGGEGKTKMGAHVIARGEGKFEGKLYGGGLPGDGWDGKNALPFKAAWKDGKVFLSATDNGKPVDDFGVIENGVIKVFNMPELKKTERKSPTLGAKPPEGAVVLFASEGDEKNWENGKLASLSDGKFLAASNPRSKKTFQSFTAHIEFRLPWMPNSTGQGRANSGVYVQDRYELQVLDSFGLSGENNECGGFYTLSKPKVNMCLPPMVWQTYDIEFTAAEFQAGKKT
ncbi:MAG: DUF1080 domain-containing protein, partial [Gemmataceae bacterium]